ncbi:MAG: LPS export ABC transporter permease LptG [Syntrophobacterales bacterium]|jgi:lipopolysaccharide export system permease protein
MEAGPRLRSQLLENYVAREFLKIFLLSLIAFCTLYLVVDFFEKIDQLVRANLGVAEMGHYVLLKAPLALEQVLSPAILLGSMLTFGLMGRTRETMAIRTSGLDILQLIRPILILAVLAAAFLLALHLYLIPWSQATLNLFWETQVQKKPPRSLLNPEHLWYKGDRAIYNILLYRKDLKTLEGVKIFRFNDRFKLVQVVAARRAVWQNGHWRLFQGIVQNFNNRKEDQIKSFEEMDLALRETPKDFGDLERKISEMNVEEIWRFVDRLERDGYKSTSYRLELQNRFSMALVPLVLAILGLGLALKREKVFIPGMVALGLGVMFAYWLALGFSSSLGQAGRWPILVAAWLPHLFFGAVAVLTLRKATR